MAQTSNLLERVTSGLAKKKKPEPSAEKLPLTERVAAALASKTTPTEPQVDAARAHVTPSTPGLTLDQATGKTPLRPLPTGEVTPLLGQPPPGSVPRAVPGLFGQPIAPIPVQREIDAEQEAEKLYPLGRITGISRQPGYGEEPLKRSLARTAESITTRGRQLTPTVPGLGELFASPIAGPVRMAHAITSMPGPSLDPSGVDQGPGITGREVAGAASEFIGGGLATAAPVLVPLGGIKALAALPLYGAGQAAIISGLTKLGVPEEYATLAADVGLVASGFLHGKMRINELGAGRQKMAAAARDLAARVEREHPNFNNYTPEAQTIVTGQALEQFFREGRLKAQIESMAAERLMGMKPTPPEAPETRPQPGQIAEGAAPAGALAPPRTPPGAAPPPLGRARRPASAPGGPVQQGSPQEAAPADAVPTPSEGPSSRPEAPSKAPETPRTPTEALASGLERTAKEVREAEQVAAGAPPTASVQRQPTAEQPAAGPPPSDRLGALVNSDAMRKRASELAAEGMNPDQIGAQLMRETAGRAIQEPPKAAQPPRRAPGAPAAPIEAAKPTEPPAEGQATRTLEGGAKPEAPLSQPAASPTKLPRELAGAKPRYSYGPKQFELSFESELDKALYILAQDKPSARDADYLTWAQAVTGQDEQALRSEGRYVKNFIKSKARVSEPGVLTIKEGDGRQHGTRLETFAGAGPQRKPPTPQLAEGAAGATPLGVPRRPPGGVPEKSPESGLSTEPATMKGSELQPGAQVAGSGVKTRIPSREADKPPQVVVDKAPPGGWKESDKVPRRAPGSQDIERYQWMRNEQGGQKQGNQTEIRPITRENFDELMKPGLREEVANFDAYRKAFPEVTHIAVYRYEGKGPWKVQGIGPIETLRDSMVTGWTKKVSEFNSLEARQFGATADQPEGIEKGKIPERLGKSVVVVDVRDREGKKIGQITAEHSNTPESIMDEARDARKQMFEEYPDASNVNSRTIATDDEGTPRWVVAPNGSKMAEIGTDEARYIAGDVSARKAVTEPSTVLPIETGEPGRVGPPRRAPGAAPEPLAAASKEQEATADVTKPTGEPSDRVLEGELPEVVPGVAESGLATAEGGRVSEPGQRDVGVGGREGSGLRPDEGATGKRPDSKLLRGKRGSQSISKPEQSGNDYRITDADGIGSGGLREKYRENVAAINLLKEIEQAGRLATPEEQAKLVRYVGWGGMPQAFGGGDYSWHAQRTELKALLTEDEYTAAKASTPNAHYTSIEVIDGIWAGLERMGFEGGRILEPSAGVGHFLGRIPNGLAPEVARTAIELDSLTGRILKQLYQTADVRVQGFEKFQGPNNFYDVVVGNVPFGNYKVYDPDYRDTRLNIHNYFILKSLDKLRPGGVTALITSSFTMDAVEQKARKLFAGKADLVGAIRLPNTAFKGNAGTEVTTDVLFFRKRAEGQKAAGPAFLELKELENGIRVNEYFANHPKMMLGKMELAGTMYGPGQAALIEEKGGVPWPVKYMSALMELPENGIAQFEAPESTTDEAVTETLADYGDVKTNGLTVKDGKVYRRLHDRLELEADYPKKKIDSLRKMLRLRDAARELLKAERTDRPAAELRDLRARLNRFYDDFYAKYGPLHSRTAMQAMRGDDLPFLLSLEKWDAAKKQATKSDTFTKRTVGAAVRVEKVETAKEAMLVSLNEKASLDFDRMSKVYGRSAEDIQDELKSEGLVFESPEGHWETSDAYLSGNVRKKLAEAESAAAVDKRFKANVEALKQVQPRTLGAEEIAVKMGSPWVPEDDIVEFMKHIIDDPYAQITVRHFELDGRWIVNERRARTSAAAGLKWGTQRVGPLELIEAVLNLRSPVVYDGSGDTRVVNQAETDAAAAKIEELHEEFRKFLLGEASRASRLAQIYNEKMNNWRVRAYDGTHLTLPGSSPNIKLVTLQKDNVWRAVVGGNQGLNEKVGVGKSFILAAIAMEWRRLGRARKVPIVIPNITMGQFPEQFRALYPASNPLVIGTGDLGGDRRRETVSRIATGDWDAVIIPHSTWEFIGVTDETFNNFMQEQIDALENFIEAVSAEEGKKSPTVKELEKAKKRLEARIQDRIKRETKDKSITFEELGFDALIVDESHAFKSLFFPTKLGRVPGVQTSDSNRAMDMYLKARYISRLNNGRNVVFATGTPLTNSITEMWTIMRYLDEGRLKEMGLEHFDSWAAMFGQMNKALEVTPSDQTKLRMNTRFIRFQNLSELLKSFRATAARHTDEEVDSQIVAPRPKLLGGKPIVHELTPNKALLDYVALLGKRADAIRDKQVKKGADNALKITGDGRKAAVDLRMVDTEHYALPPAEDFAGSKLNEVARTVARIYHEHADEKAAQIVFLDLGTPSDAESGEFNAYRELKKKIVALDVPPEQVAFIHDYDKPADKLELSRQMNAGETRIMVGSTSKAGIGLNVQQRLYAAHHVDIPWTPAMLEQRNGRFIRQGNSFPFVEEHHYVMKQSFDAYMWQLMEGKAKFVNEGLSSDMEAREIEDIDGRALSASEIKALATGNPLVMEKAKVDMEVGRLQRLFQAHDTQQWRNRLELAVLPERMEATNKRLKLLRADAKKRDEKVPEKFAITIGKESYDDRKLAGAKINEIVLDPKGAGKIGTYGGFEIVKEGAADNQFMVGSYPAFANEESPLGTVQSLETSLRNIDVQAEKLELLQKGLAKEQKERAEGANAPFPKKDELDALLVKQKEIDKQLEVGKTSYSHSTVEPEDGEDQPSGILVDFLGMQTLYERAAALLRKVRRQPEVAPGPVAEAEVAPPRKGPPRRAPGVRRPASEGPVPVGDKAINIRLDKLNAPDEILDVIRQVAKEKEKEINEQRRGKRANRTTRDAAQQLVDDGLMGPEFLVNLEKGTALNAEELLAARGVLIETAHLSREAATVARGSGSVADLLRFKEAVNRHQAVQRAVSGAVAEAGRTLQQQRMIAKALRAAKRDPMDEVLESLGGRELSEEEARLLAQIPEGDVVGLNKFLRRLGDFSTIEKVQSYWINSILSGTRTQLRNILGTMSFVTVRPVFQAVRGVVDRSVSKMQGRPREYHSREAWYGAMAARAGIIDGAHKALFILKNGFDLSKTEQIDVPRYYEFTGKWAPLGYPGRGLRAADAFFKAIIARSERYSLAAREIIHEDLKGDAFKERMAYLITNPTEAMLTAELKEGRYWTFNQPPGKLTRRVLSLRNEAGLPGTFAVPFISTMANIIKTGGEFSPAGAGRLFGKEVRGGKEASDVIAKALVGTAMMLVVAILADEDRLTGKAPTGAAAREAFLAKHPAFSVKIGGRWYGYQYLGPVGFLMAGVAALHDAWREGDTPTEDRIAQVAAAMGSFVVEQSMFQGMLNIIEGIKDPFVEGARWARDVAKGFVPFSGLQRNIAQAIDPKVRNPRSFYEHVLAGLPFASKTVPARVGVLGEETERRGGSGMAAFLPSPMPSEEMPGKVDKELSRLVDLGLQRVGFAGRRITVDGQPINFDREQQDAYQRLRGATIRSYLGYLFDEADYAQMADEDKLEAARDVIGQAERDAIEEMRNRMRSKQIETRQGPPRRPPGAQFVAPNVGVQ